MLTTLATVAIARAFGQSHGRALLYGFIFSLSSTTIMLRARRSAGTRRSARQVHRRTLIFRDLLVVPMVLIVPMPAPSRGGAADLAVLVEWAPGKALLVAGTIAFAARLVVPRVLDWVDESGSREVFLLPVLGLCIGTARHG